MDSKIEEAARRVTSIQAEYDGMNHNTTGASFMQQHGIKWLYERDRILKAIDVRRTAAIWELDRALSAQAAVADTAAPAQRIIH
jgi:hypothetical protein